MKAAPWLTGRTLKGIYRILELVGTGGFADVYLARDLNRNAVVAVKILHDQFARDPRIVERFLREARVAQSLDDPHVVCVLDSGEEDGVHFIVMEYVEGHTLSDLIQRQGQLPVDEAVDYVRQALEALSVAHRAGVVHRDVKPQNVMVTDGGLVKVMDFGIAKDLTAGGGTVTTMYLGTPRYMSPEQASGAPATTRSDLYAVAITLYELLAGKPPFNADTPWQILNLHVTAAPPPIATVRDNVPVEVQQVLARGLRKDPDRRFQTAEEMLVALDRGVTDDPDVDETPTIAQPTGMSVPTTTAPARRSATEQPKGSSMRAGGARAVALPRLPRSLPPVAVAAVLVVAVLVGAYFRFGQGRVASTTWAVMVGDDGGPPAPFERPSSLSLDQNGDLTVVDSRNYWVTALSPTGHLLGRWGQQGTTSPDGEIQSGVATDSQGNVYVADAQNDVVRKYSPDGKLLAQWGEKGSGPGQFDHPEGIAVDAQGNVYVADVNLSRIQKLSPAGTPIAQWGTEGTGSNQFHHPRDLTVDEQGNLYVADTDNQRVVKLSPSGAPLASWGTEGTGPGQFRVPAGLTVDRNGNVFIADMENHRIQELSPTGQPLAQWGTRGSGVGQFTFPTDVAVDGQGNLYVADSGNRRIQVGSMK